MRAAVFVRPSHAQLDSSTTHPTRQIVDHFHLVDFHNIIKAVSKHLMTNLS
jgi:hypothetical protein